MHAKEVPMIPASEAFTSTHERSQGKRTVFSSDEVRATTTFPGSSSRSTSQRARPAIADICVTEVMTRDVLCVSPDLSLDGLRALLVERGISGVPVVDDRGVPMGMISKSDLVRRVYEDAATGEGTVRLDEEGLEPGFHVERSCGTVADYMLPIAHTLGDDAPLAHAAALMAWEGVHRIPVCAADGTVVGIITTLDIARWVAATAGYPSPK
jgi:CBS domain-containing protein